MHYSCSKYSELTTRYYAPWRAYHTLLYRNKSHIKFIMHCICHIDKCWFLFSHKTCLNRKVYTISEVFVYHETSFSSGWFLTLFKDALFSLQALLHMSCYQWKKKHYNHKHHYYIWDQGSVCQGIHGWNNLQDPNLMKIAPLRLIYIALWC